ncbi:MAG: hypothetical protein AAGA84_12220 [Pseudomonadota bacterium]
MWYLACCLWLLWFGVAASAWRTSTELTQHQLPVGRRLSAATQLRTGNTALLLLQYGLLIVAILLLGPVKVAKLDLGLSITLLVFTGINVFLVFVTWRMPILPGRSALRLTENILIVFWGIGLAVMALIWMLSASGVLLYRWYLALLGLGVSFLLFAAARPYLRGAIMVARHVQRHGSHARREATMKRLLRRWRPLLVINGVTLMTSGVLLMIERLA